MPGKVMLVSPFDLSPCKNPMSSERNYHHSHFSDEKAEAQRDEVIFLRLHDR